MDTKKVVIKEGAKGWFLTPFKDADVFEIAQDTEIAVEEYSQSWYRTVGHVSGFPAGHPALLVLKKDVE